MAKGKEALAAAKRRELEARDLLDIARCDLGVAKSEIRGLRHKLATLESLRPELARLRADLEACTSDEVRRLQAAVDHYQQLVSDLEETVGTVRKVWSVLLAEVGGSYHSETVERLLAAVKGVDDVVVAANAAEVALAKRYGNESLRRYQKSRRSTTKGG